MVALIQEVRVAFRQVRKAPGFALTVVLTLALGIGATTAIFSLVQGILLRPLPFSQPDRLVLLGDRLRTGAGTPVTAREIATYSNASSAFSSMGGYDDATYELSGGTTPEQINAARLGTGVFTTLGVQPIRGRVFTHQEEDSHQPLAVISYALWLNRYHSDPEVVGRSVVLDRKPYMIIGVMPRDFEFPLQNGRLNQAQLWVPLSLTAEELSDAQTGSFRYHMVARLHDGVTLTQAAQDADRVAQIVMHNYPPHMAAIHIQGAVTPLLEYVVSNVRPLLRTLFLAVAVVLLIACANVAGLLLVRAIRRRREYAVRLALGAGSGVILREAMFEGLVLSLAGGLLGLAFAAGAIRTALHLLPESMPRIASISLDGRVAAFDLLLALLSGVLCSLAPAFAALRTNLTQSLKESSRGGSGGASHAWLRSILVVSEIAVALVLLTASGAFLRSFQKMRAVDPGFRADHVVVASYQLPLEQYPTETSVANFRRAVVDRLSSQPGAVAASMASVLPGSGVFAGAAYTIEGEPAEQWKLKFSNFTIAYGDFFKAMSIPLRQGRTFTRTDNASAPLVIVVNETMAKHCWPGQSPVGRRMHLGNPKKGLPWATVIGVVADTKVGPRDEPNSDQWYMPAEQPAILFGIDPPEKLAQAATGFIALRSALPVEQMMQHLRAAVAETDSLLALQQVQPMSDVIANVEAQREFNTDLITSFAMAALLLAITGIYAVVAFSVSLRTQEIAIRMALGAQRTGIARLILIWGAKLAGIGCALGVIGSLATSRLVSSFLFEVSATDPIIYAVGVLIMMLMALVASALPASRAASTDPIDALRSV